MARISPGTMTVAIFAILIALGGAYAVRQYLYQPPAVVEEVPEEQPPQIETVYVPVASHQLEAGRRITISDIALLQYTPEELQESPYAGLPYMRSTKFLEGRVVKDPIDKGNAFLTTSLYPEGMAPGITDLLAPGLRAVSVPIHNVAAVTGFARPGSYVDVLFRSYPTDQLPEVTITLLESVQILAVDKLTLPQYDINLVNDASSRAPSATVTLGVTPQQAKVLKVVESRGEMTLSLRSDEEIASVESSHPNAVTIEQILGIKHRPQIKRMEIYRGGTSSIRQFREMVPVETSVPGPMINTPIVTPHQPQQNVRQADDGNALESAGTSRQPTREELVLEQLNGRTGP